MDSAVHAPEVAQTTNATLPRASRWFSEEMNVRTAAADVENDVPAPPAHGHVFHGVVDDLVGPKRKDQVGLGGAAHPDDEHPLPLLHPAVIAHSLQRGQAGDSGRGRFANPTSAGLAASLPSRARAYSANDPAPIPNTSSPGATRVT